MFVFSVHCIFQSWPTVDENIHKEKCEKFPWPCAWRILAILKFSVWILTGTHVTNTQILCRFLGKAELGWFVAVIPVITPALLNTCTVTSCNEKWHEYKTQWDFHFLSNHWWSISHIYTMKNRNYGINLIKGLLGIKVHNS